MGPAGPPGPIASTMSKGTIIGPKGDLGEKGEKARILRAG